MKTIAAKKANRGHLLRAAKKGQLFVKCKYSMTDDYAFDAATEFGKMDEFVQVYLMPKYERPESIDESERCKGETDQEYWDRHYRKFVSECDDEQGNRIRLWTSDFRSKSGHMVGDTQNGYFNIHSNLSYEYEIRN